MNWVLSILLLFCSTAGAQSKLRFDAIEDATVKYNSSSSNFGSAITLESDSSPRSYAFLKFQLSGLSGTIQSAKLRLFVTNSSSSAPEVFVSPSTWQEATITWNTRPSTSTSYIADKGSISSGNWIEYDVLRAVSANGVLSFALKPDSSDGSDFASRESANKPHLIVELSGSPTPTPTPTPSPTPAPSPTASPTPTPTPTATPVAYFDDTHSLLGSGMATSIVTGAFGYDNYEHSASADGRYLAIDARQASWTVANSRNSFPTFDNDCNSGALETNRYPVTIRYADLTAFVGGLFNGLIPQESDWRPSYCNSAAISYREAKNGVVDGVRITSAWDAVRAASGSPNIVIKNSWFSGVRDDVVENDYRYSATFADSLVDGTFQFISIRPSSGSTVPDSSANLVTVSGVVVRIRTHLYYGEPVFGAIFKTSSSGAPKGKIVNSVIAVDPGNGESLSDTNWLNTWKDLVECKNNLFLWLSDKQIPPEVGTIPACFTVVRGAAAVEAWNRAKTNWINCHPRVARGAGDPASDVSQCRAGEYGGFTD